MVRSVAANAVLRKASRKGSSNNQKPRREDARETFPVFMMFPLNDGDLFVSVP